MKTKEGVVLAGLQLKMRIVLVRAALLWELNGQELVITSALDGCHSPGSLHPYGYAVDLRTRYFEPDKVKNIATDLYGGLPEGYEVVTHKTHIHVEFDGILHKGG